MHAVLKSTLEKLALVGVITVDPKVQAQELTQSVGEEITKMIAQQKDLEKRFENLVSVQHILRTLPNKSKLRENQVCSSIQPGACVKLTPAGTWVVAATNCHTTHMGACRSAAHALVHAPLTNPSEQAELQQVAEALRQSTKQLCRNLKDNPNVAENMAKVAAERQALQLLINNTLNELDVFKKVSTTSELWEFGGSPLPLFVHLWSFHCSPLTAPHR